jgi:hypothetical protein
MMADEIVTTGQPLRDAVQLCQVGCKDEGKRPHNRPTRNQHERRDVASSDIGAKAFGHEERSRAGNEGDDSGKGHGIPQRSAPTSTRVA